MPQVYFYKLDEMSAMIRNIATIIWLIRIEATNEEYYIHADKVHSTLQKGRYWADKKHLIEIRTTQKSEFGGLQQKDMLMKPRGEPNIYQQIQCGKCNQVNLVQIDPLIQGAHYCTKCKGTVCVIAGKHLQLKNASKALSTISR